jgi:hypothetical protein
LIATRFFLNNNRSAAYCHCFAKLYVDDVVISTATLDDFSESNLCFIEAYLQLNLWRRRSVMFFRGLFTVKLVEEEVSYVLSRLIYS